MKMNSSKVMVGIFCLSLLLLFTPPAVLFATAVVIKGNRVTETDRMKRALEVHKNWIWGDGLEIAKLRTRMKHLEQDQVDLKAFINRILAKSDN